MTTEIKSAATARPFSDSPWFWAYLFTAFALIALALIAPKYAARQAQLERQFEGRQHADQPGNLQPAQPSALIPLPNPTRITLKPLFLGLATLTMIVWFFHWRTSLSQPA